MLEALGNIGDFIGGLTVVVTIGYLAVQMRGNMVATRRATYQDLLNHIAQVNYEILHNDELLDLLIAGKNQGVGGLCERDLTRVQIHYGSVFRHYENAWQQWRENNINDNQLEQLVGPLPSTMRSRSAQDIWGRMAPQFSADFQAFVAAKSSVSPRPVSHMARFEPQGPARSAGRVPERPRRLVPLPAAATDAGRDGEPPEAAEWPYSEGPPPGASSRLQPPPAP